MRTTTSPVRRLLRALLSAAILAGLLVPAAGPAGASSRPAYKCRDRGEQVYRLMIPVGGEVATGHYAVPRRPLGLVVFGHGYGHTSLSWVHHLREAAGRGLIAVAMDYRGMDITPDANDDGLPEARGWPAIDGAEDLLAAARLFEGLCRVDTVTMLGVSMGVNMAGLAVAFAGERDVLGSDGEPLFDHFVDVEGAANLIETYQEARAAAPAIEFARRAREDIEVEVGGTFEQRPDEYRRRSVVARVPDLAAAGVDAIVLHGLDDGLVPYNQSRELVGLLRDAGVTTEMITFGRRDEDSERETTLTGHAAGAIYKDYMSPLSGHASEKSTTHIVMETALARLWSLMAGSPPLDRECLINAQVPDPLRARCSA